MKNLFFILIIFSSIQSSFSQSYEPIELAKVIFNKDSFPDINNYITGEYNGHPNGTDIPKQVKASFLLLGQNNETAVVNITFSDGKNPDYDTYLHFKNDSVWKATAFRALAMTGIIAQVNTMLKDLGPAQVDSILNIQHTDSTQKKPMFLTRDEYEFTLKNTNLTLASDKEIINHFNKNKAEFERIKDKLLEQLKDKEIVDYKSIKIGEDIEKDYKKLFINSITTGGYLFTNSINFLIGGILDNTVGYIYVADIKDLPKMTPHNIIMLRKISDSWYMYKTT